MAKLQRIFAYWLCIQSQPETKKLTMRILALDPGKQMGYFYFENWSNYEISTLEGKNYLEQAKNLENLLKNKPVQVLI